MLLHQSYPANCHRKAYSDCSKAMLIATLAVRRTSPTFLTRRISTHLYMKSHAIRRKATCTLMTRILYLTSKTFALPVISTLRVGCEVTETSVRDGAVFANQVAG
jgi:hypothetical protein